MRAWIAASILGLLVGCAESEDAVPPPDILLISLDTLRADRLGAYGYERETSPRIDAFAGRGALFENVVAESSWTLPSHVTMLTGTYPSSHGVVRRIKQAGPDLRFLAQELGDAGYRTLGLTEGGYMSEIYGFARGFDVFDEDTPSLARSLERVERFIEDGDGPFFAFVHTYAIHCPYDPPDEYARAFRSSDASPFETAGKCGNPDYNTVELGPGQVRHVADQYDASIRQVDDWLGAFLERLAASGRLGRTIVLITSDHGEELHEHGKIGHDGTLYVETLLVPLVLVGPGIEPRRVETPVGLVDLAPTLIDLAGRPIPGDMEGRSLRELLDGDEGGGGGSWPAHRVSELAGEDQVRSVWTPTHHLLVHPESRRRELYDLRSDPTEQRDLAERDPDRVEELRAALAEYRSARRARRRSAAADLEELSPERLERLRALGYTE